MVMTLYLFTCKFVFSFPIKLYDQVFNSSRLKSHGGLICTRMLKVIANTLLLAISHITTTENLDFSSSFSDLLRHYQKPMICKRLGAKVKNIALLSKTNASTHEVYAAMLEQLQKCGSNVQYKLAK